MQWIKKIFPKAQSLTVDRQSFNLTDAKVLVAASTSPLFNKMRKELHCELLTMMLCGRASEDFRDGWIECIAYLDGLVERSRLEIEANAQQISDNGEKSSMQMDDD
jgi:hypothetical protein